MAAYLATALHNAGEEPVNRRRSGTAYRLAVWEGGDIRAFTVVASTGTATLAEPITLLEKAKPVRSRNQSRETYEQFLRYLCTWEIWGRSGQAYEPGIDGPLYLIGSITDEGYRWYASYQELPELLLASQWLAHHFE